MDLRKLSKALPLSSMSGNGTENMTLTNLSPSILEALVPGYGLISRYLLGTFGIDISIFVIIGIAAFALVRGGTYVWRMIERAFRYYLMCSVVIEQHDDLFEMVMAWLATHQEVTSNTQQVRAKTQRGSNANDADDLGADDALDEHGMFDYNKWSARTPPRYEPHYGSQFVWHKGRMFSFSLQRQETGQKIQLSYNGTQDMDDVIQLDCIGRDIEPLKDLLRTIKVWSLNRQRYMTTIRHPTPKDRARFGGTWSKTSSRPSRPMDTVILDPEQKKMIIDDMNEYLHPASAKWYATRGIPYRRGYLLHGPPGTGKTSLSFALAGTFKVEIYVISLQDLSLTEGDFMQLFNTLPPRCIVLLEDVDAAGLMRDGNSDDAESKGRKKAKEGDKEGKKDSSERSGKAEDFTLKDVVSAIKEMNTPKPGRRAGPPVNRSDPNQAANTGISLSGLLNAIDGVATHEGRVLIMTTNHPEKLDAALVRPGRVDRKVAFKLAMKEQVSELFVRMYTASDEGPFSSNGNANGHANGGKGKAVSTGDDSAMSRARLEELAADFAGHIPDATFTPAEIQNLLMRHKKDPRAAVAAVEQWMQETLEEKAEKDEDEDEKDEEA